jgi:hypothetical protein
LYMIVGQVGQHKEQLKFLEELVQNIASSEDRLEKLNAIIYAERVEDGTVNSGTKGCCVTRDG